MLPIPATFYQGTDRCVQRTLSRRKFAISDLHVVRRGPLQRNPILTKRGQSWVTEFWQHEAYPGPPTVRTSRPFLGRESIIDTSRLIRDWMHLGHQQKFRDVRIERIQSVDVSCRVIGETLR